LGYSVIHLFNFFLRGGIGAFFKTFWEGNLGGISEFPSWLEWFGGGLERKFFGKEERFPPISGSFLIKCGAFQFPRFLRPHFYYSERKVNGVIRGPEFLLYLELLSGLFWVVSHFGDWRVLGKIPVWRTPCWGFFGTLSKGVLWATASGFFVRASSQGGFLGPTIFGGPWGVTGPFCVSIWAFFPGRHLGIRKPFGGLKVARCGSLFFLETVGNWFPRSNMAPLWGNPQYFSGRK